MPPVTERTEVGAAPDDPARVIVTVVAVPVEYPAVTDALLGEAADDAIEYGVVEGLTVTV